MSNPPGHSEKNGKQYCLPPLSFKISLKIEFFHISLNSLGFYLYPEYWIYSNLVYSTINGEKKLIYGVHIPRKCIEYMHFYSCQFPIQKSRQDFWKTLSPKMKEVEKTMICFIKIQSKNMKMTLYFVWFTIFLNVMALHFCKYLSNSVVLSLLSFLCNHSSLTLKLHQKE